MSLLDDDVEQLTAASGYRFSATKIDNLGSAEYTLSTVVQDASGSVLGYKHLLEQAIKTVFGAMCKSPRKESLMLRLTQFNDDVRELHGFKLLNSIKDTDYDNVLTIGGATALCDATDEAIQATAVYAKQLKDQDFLCNAIIVVITDGDGNYGNIRDPLKVRQSLENVVKQENLESITVILVGITQDDVNLDIYLQDFKDKVGINQYVSIGAATPQKIAKLAQFVSQSISSTSAALGTGQASQPVNFTF